MTAIRKNALPSDPAPPDVYDFAAGPVDTVAVDQSLALRGFAILRNLFNPSLLAACNERIDAFMARPAIGGTVGYAKVDYPKRVANPFAVGGPVCELLADERVLDIVERRMRSTCVLAETILKFDRATPYTYFPIHADFAPGWRKSDISTFQLSEEGMNDPIGIGGVLYLHDTDDGAFTYGDGTHLLKGFKGQNLTDYTAEERREIGASLVRCKGQAGDIVIFDDRGFHGPQQPSRAERRAILLDYYRVETFGKVQVSPMPIWSNDLARFSARQMEVVGLGADFMVPPEQYTGTRFRRHKLYSALCWLIEHSYTVGHLVRLAKHKLRLK